MSQEMKEGERGGAGYQIGTPDTHLSMHVYTVHPNHLGRAKARIAQRVNEGSPVKTVIFWAATHTWQPNFPPTLYVDILYLEYFERNKFSL